MVERSSSSYENCPSKMLRAHTFKRRIRIFRFCLQSLGITRRDLKCPQGRGWWTRECEQVGRVLYPYFNQGALLSASAFIRLASRETLV